MNVLIPRQSSKFPLNAIRTSRKTALQSPHSKLRRHLFNGTADSSTLTASRTLNYPALSLFELITDINSYPTFLPYCRHARVLSESEPDEHYQRRWPQTATLTVGFNHDTISETFDSKVWCVPPIPEKGRAGIGIVESISGTEAPAAPQFAADEHIKHHVPDSDNTPKPNDSPLKLLRSRWEFRAYPHKTGPEDGKRPQETSMAHTKAIERTDVSLRIEYKFNNAMYDVLSQAVAGKAADMMVEAFEKRAGEVLNK